MKKLKMKMKMKLKLKLKNNIIIFLISTCIYLFNNYETKYIFYN